MARRGLGMLAALATIAAAPVPAPAPPAWEVAHVVPHAIAVKAAAYRVRRGDTLSRIVARTGAGADAIARANALAAPFRLLPGRLLTIPPGRYHAVAKGESGIAIARAYGVDWSRIAALNHLEEPFILRAGQHLLLPSRSETAKMTLEERAAAFRIDIDDLVTGSEPALAPRARPAAPTRSAAAPIAPTMAVAPPAAPVPGRFRWPVTGRTIRRFGAQPNGGRNDGIDVAAPAGTPIVAAADGVVAYAGTLAGFGQLALVRHGGTYLTAYGHAERLLVTRGQAVKAGQPIGRVGATGTAPEPELHFEIRQGRRPLDPARLLPPG